MSVEKSNIAGEHSSITVTISAPSHDLTTQNQRNSPFLRLPAELRNAIYNLVMTDYIITVCGSQRCSLCWNFHESDHTVVHCPQEVIALTSTCRQIHADTHFLPYSSNIFCGFAEDLMKPFDDKFTQQHTAAITSLCVLTRREMIFSGLRRLSGLQRVTMASQHAQNRLSRIPGDQLRKISVRYMIKEINMLRNAEHVEVKMVKSAALPDMGIDWRDCPSPIRPRP